MTPADHTILIILAVLMSTFFFLLALLTLFLVQVALAVKRVVRKAENVVETVEDAAEILRETSGRASWVKIINNIIKLSQKKGRK